MRSSAYNGIMFDVFNMELREGHLWSCRCRIHIPSLGDMPPHEFKSEFMASSERMAYAMALDACHRWIDANL